jgi:adenine phosphoribosyltransferase
MNLQTLAQRLGSAIDDHPDFPEKGIVFKDMMPILSEPSLFSDVVDCFCGFSSIIAADAIVGLDARGFLFASAVALRSSKPLVVARKPGKLPGKLLSKSYDLEYGQNELSVQLSALSKFNKFAIIDDLLATGGTAGAVVDIIESCGKSVEGVCVVVELGFLGGAGRIGSKVESILRY